MSSVCANLGMRSDIGQRPVAGVAPRNSRASGPAVPAVSPCTAGLRYERGERGGHRPALGEGGQIAWRAGMGRHLRAGLFAASKSRMERSVTGRSLRMTVSNSTKKKFSSFEDMLAGSETPLLVDFYATWCGPCQMLIPVLDEVAIATRGKMQVVKINTETYPDLARTYQINALPCLILFKNGKPVDRIEGFLTAQQLLPRLQYFVGK